MSKLYDLIAEKNQYDKVSQDQIQSYEFLASEISKLKEMKATDGWKILEKKIREELQARILKMVETDERINVLLSLLEVSETKKKGKALEEEINKLLPDS